jgi:hypothetical protein
MLIDFFLVDCGVEIKKIWVVFLDFNSAQPAKNGKN